MGYNLILNSHKSVNIKVWHKSKMSAAERLCSFQIDNIFETFEQL